MKNTPDFHLGATKNKGKKYLHFVWMFMLVSLAFSCEEQESEITSGAPQTRALRQQADSSATIASSSLSKQQALEQINDLFKDELEPMKPEQVQRINKHQFVQWLQRSKLAAAEQLDLAPLLSDDAAEFVLLKEVTLQKNGKRTNFALVGVPPQLYLQYSQGIVLQDLDDNDFTQVCLWFECKKVRPNFTFCLKRMKIIAPPEICPASQCSSTNPCKNGAEKSFEGDFRNIVAAF
jgi:hypothetical protein